MGRWLGPLIVAAALALGGPVGAGAQAGSWLDAPPRSFNAPGAAVPAAPAAVSGNRDRCRDRERAAATPEEALLAAAGWRLESYWPTQRAGDLAVVTATADYDGMCRPAGFNGFAFAGGRYAGALAPEPMISRLDGALVDAPTVGADGRIVASFVRYASTDPLCCPSRGHTRVTYRVATGAAGPTLVPEQIVQVPPAAPTPGPVVTAPTPGPVVTAPTQLPRTGGPPLATLLAPALALLGAGRLLRGRLRSRA
jgi:hypothetical protein